MKHDLYLVKFFYFFKIIFNNKTISKYKKILF